MEFIDWFAGIGGFHTGLEQAGMTCAGYCEIDTYARRSYEAIYDTKELWTATDIRYVRGWDVPDVSLYSFGFPCQDISIAGRKRGIHKGTRSGLFFEIMRIIDEKEEDKPEWLVAENVRHLLSIDDGWGFYTVLTEMGNRGYAVEWQVYNTKNYGLPQNRERLYLVGHLGGNGGRKVLPQPRQATNPTTIKQVGNFMKNRIFGNNPQTGRVYDPSGIAPTLNTCGGGSHEPKIIVNGVFPSGKYQRGRVFDVNGISATVMASDYKEPQKIETAKGIRKLTPRECWRLQGFSDEQFEKAAAIHSNSQLYKQAGNSVSVPIVKEIGESILRYEKEWEGNNE